MDLKNYLLINSKLDKFSFGDFIRQRREELGLTIRTIVKQLEISPAYWCDIEKGSRLAPCKLLNEMVKILKIDESDRNDFIDLAYLSHETCAPDLIEYLIANKSARIALREEINGNKPKISKISMSSSGNFNPNNLTFGKYVRARREELGISLRELSKNIGVSAAYFHEVEIGEKHATIKYLHKLEQYLEIPEEHKRDFEDLAFLDYGDCAQYITNYMLESREARLAVRYLIENNISGEQLFNLVQNRKERTYDIN